MKTIIFDIETGALPDDQLLAMLPPFDPGEVKTGNIKNPELIQAKLDEAEKRHFTDFKDKAALDALTGRVVAIGLLEPEGEPVIVGEADERRMLLDFWAQITDATGFSVRLIGFNCHLFDLPFLIRRSWVWGVPIPLGLRNGRYFDASVVDLRNEWQLGDRQAHGSLDRIARCLGLGAKNGNGKDFAALWAADRSKAEEYLKNDLRLTQAIAQRMGVIPI